MKIFQKIMLRLHMEVNYYFYYLSLERCIGGEIYPFFYFSGSSLPANYQFQSIISHKGTSVHCGHYVAHVFKDQEWVLFNDDKVVNSQPPLEEAYVYILGRKHS